MGSENTRYKSMEIKLLNFIQESTICRIGLRSSAINCGHCRVEPTGACARLQWELHSAVDSTGAASVGSGV
jgi:hypothetical protein